MAVQIASDYNHRMGHALTYSRAEALPQGSGADLDWPDLAPCCQMLDISTSGGKGQCLVYLYAWRSQGCGFRLMLFIKRRWTLANLTFIFPLASCIPPVLNYSNALTCLKLAHDTLCRLQWILLFQIHIFRTWLCFPKHAITVGQCAPCSKSKNYTLPKTLMSIFSGSRLHNTALREPFMCLNMHWRGRCNQISSSFTVCWGACEMCSKIIIKP